MGERKQIVEIREETCSIVSKLVKLKIFRSPSKGEAEVLGEIVGFECSSSSQSCITKCHYRILMDDF